MDLSIIERELKKRLGYPYVWGVKQNDEDDSLTNFVYRISDFDEVLRVIQANLLKEKEYQHLFNYALNRWFNFWSAKAIEEIFCNCSGVLPAENHQDKYVDFSINSIDFDHKTTVFPQGFKKPIDEAVKNPKELIEWLYDNQSQEQRKHKKNRLFIVLFSQNGNHWKLKAEISWLKTLIVDYVSNFNEEHLIVLNFPGQDKVYSDVIWAKKASNN